MNAPVVAPHATHRVPPSIVVAAGPGDAREWLVANGLGGYASGTVGGPPARRHHGWFVPNLDAPPGRHVLIPRLDDAIATPRGPRPLRGGLTGFRLDGTVPAWCFELDGSRLEREVAMPHGRNAVCIRWRLVAGPPVRLLLRPYVDARRQDAALRPGAGAPWRRADVRAGTLVLALDAVATLRLRASAAVLRFDADALVDRGVVLETERARGYDHVDDQHSPGHWTVELSEGDEASVAAGLADEPDVPPAADVIAAEHARCAALLASAAAADRDDRDPVRERLVLAADAFVVRPAAGRRDGHRDAHAPAQRSVIAGYPWFTDWGRDTMISLEGLALSTGRHVEAATILRTFAGYVRDGLIPNLFPEGDRDGLYHTADATLWFFHALGRHRRHTGDAALVHELMPVLRDVIAHHVRGTRFGIGVDPSDGLLRAAADGYALTWMDARMGDWVVTPRRGKPVEIQALWYDALRSFAGWARESGVPDDGADALADRVAASFDARFRSPAHDHLLDVVDGPEGDDASLRPNQVFAMSLAHPVLAPGHRAGVLDAVSRALLTPVGLRTLAPDAPGYRARYAGDLRARDGAYHQGTVWPWLLGHYVDAWVRVHGPGPRARALLDALPAGFVQGAIGHVAEVFDAEPPHRPGGCFAQAWSVAELLRAWIATRGSDDG